MAYGVLTESEPPTDWTGLAAISAVPASALADKAPYIPADPTKESGRPNGVSEEAPLPFAICRGGIPSNAQATR